MGHRQLISIALFFALLGGALIHASTAEAAQRLLSDPPLESYLVSCAETAKIRITAPSGDLLTVKSLEARSNGNLVAGIVSLMRMYCPQFQRITFVGTVGDALWFAGMTSEAQDWRLVGLHAAP